jgi:general secretion pathway protein C
MKRWPVVASFVLFVALCASIAFWTMQLLKPVTRPVAAAPALAAEPPARLEAAYALFGGRKSAVQAENYTLKGVIVARNPKESAAIITTDGKPAKVIPVDTEVSQGVTLKEVHGQFVLLSQGGREKRVELPDKLADRRPGDRPSPQQQAGDRLAAEKLAAAQKAAAEERQAAERQAAEQKPVQTPPQ